MHIARLFGKHSYSQQAQASASAGCPAQGVSENSEETANPSADQATSREIFGFNSTVVSVLNKLRIWPTLTHRESESALEVQILRKLRLRLRLRDLESAEALDIVTYRRS